MNILVKIIAELGMKLLREALVSKVAVYTLYELSKNTANKLDDKIVGAVAEALSVKPDWSPDVNSALSPLALAGGDFYLHNFWLSRRISKHNNQRGVLWRQLRRAQKALKQAAKKAAKKMPLG